MSAASTPIAAGVRVAYRVGSVHDESAGRAATRSKDRDQLGDQTVKVFSVEKASSVIPRRPCRKGEDAQRVRPT
jgi:hypothetical protein